MASSMCMRKVLKLMLVISICIVTGSAIRVDKQRGFKLCPGRQLGRIVSVEGGGAGCRKSNGQTQWPCLAIPGRAGTFSISFTHETPGGFNKIVSSIHAIVKLRGLFNIKQRVPIQGEARKNACSETSSQTARGPQRGCPIRPGVVHTINKKVKVPGAVRLAERNMNVEVKITDTKGNNIVCFTVPMINP